VIIAAKRTSFKIGTEALRGRIVAMTNKRRPASHQPPGLFNASLEGNPRRAIDLRQGDRIDAQAFKTLIGAAVAFNTAGR